MSNLIKYSDNYEKLGGDSSSKSGGQGTTFLVKKKLSNSDDPTYILKVLNKNNDPERRARMRREFTSLETLSIRGIPAAVDSNTEYFRDLNYKLFIVMEYIPGNTIEEYVKKAILSELTIVFSDIIVFFNKLVDIIKACHLQDVGHRDLKPDNIVLKDNDLKDPFLVDFGQSFNEYEGTIETPDAQIMGNRFLFLPELSKHSTNKKDFRSDITMAVGILFYLLTGKEPGHLVDEELKLPHQKVLYSQLLCVVEPSIWRGIERIFDKSFQQNINNRFQGIDALKDEFSEVINRFLNTADSESKLSEFNKSREVESKTALLTLDNKLDELFAFISLLSESVSQKFFNNTLEKAAGKKLKSQLDGIGGMTFVLIDKLSSKQVSFKIIGQIIGNEIVFIGDIIHHALDDNIVLSDGDVIRRINYKEKLQLSTLDIEEYIKDKTILYLS